MKRGFTIIEVLLATVILFISLIGGSFFFYANRRNLVTAKIKRLATWSAIDRVEQLKTRSYADVADEVENVTLAGVAAQRTTGVVEVTEDGVTFKRVTVQVVWATGNVSLVTYTIQP